MVVGGLVLTVMLVVVPTVLDKLLPDNVVDKLARTLKMNRYLKED